MSSLLLDLPFRTGQRLSHSRRTRRSDPHKIPGAISPSVLNISDTQYLLMTPIT